MSLNIKNTFDLVEKLTPLLYYLTSVLEKFINVCQNYHPIIPIYFNITVYPNWSGYSFNNSLDRIYNVFFRFDDLENVNIFQKIKLGILEKLESNYFNHFFNTKPIIIDVTLITYFPPPTIVHEISPPPREGGEGYETETDEEDEQINTSKSFKSDECVICLSNPPNVLFYNYGHLCLCVECEDVKSLVVCPICKTKNMIKRTIEY